MGTDSFLPNFDTQLVEFLKQNKEFDFIELDKNYPLYNPINKKVIGKMKIETRPVLV